MRFTSFWAIAPSTPTTMVNAATHSSSSEAPSEGKSSVWVRMMAYTPTLVSSPAKRAVMGVGAVG